MSEFLLVIGVIAACVFLAVGVIISVVMLFAQLGWYFICWNFGLLVMALCWDFVKHLFKTLRIAQRAEMEERLLAAKNARDEVAAECEKAQKFEDTIRAKAGLPTYRLPKSH